MGGHDGPEYAAFGEQISQMFFVLVIIGFAASMMMVQSTVSRVIWAFSRDKILPGSAFISKLSRKHSTPNRATVIVGVLTILVTLMAFSDRVYATLIASATTTFFITMGLAVTGLLIHPLTKKWQRGVFSLGFMTMPIVLGAVCWIFLEVANSAWPREIAGQNWYVNWAVFIGVSLVAISGVSVWVNVRKNLRGSQVLSQASDLTPAPI